MRVPFSASTAFRLVLALTVPVGSAVLLSSSDKPALTALDKAYYADPSAVNFVRPGLVVKILSASIAQDGTIQVRFTLADPKGLPLDREGVFTPGAVSTRFVASWIPNGATKYQAYTVRSVTSTITGHQAFQGTSDSGGTYAKIADGEYTYTFRTKAPASFDRAATHSIGLWAARNLSEFEMEGLANYDADVYTFVPSGAAVTVTRDVVRTATCNKCHDPLSAHDERLSVELCILCHNPQSGDPDTDNTMDMAQMTHKIHMGSQLPSVRAGGKYQIIGFQGSVHDYSNVVFPADARNCESCHDPNSGAAQANAWLRPTKAGCGSCHDNVIFETGVNHANLPQPTENLCSTCHMPQGEIEFDASVRGAHTIPTQSAQLPGTVFEITGVQNGAAGSKPTVTFTVKDKSGAPITDISKMRLQIVMAGPTSDYSNYVSESVIGAPGSGGTYTYTFKAAVPAGATGSYAMGIEGYRSIDISPGTVNQQTVRDAGVNKVFYFSVDGSPLAPRREVVSLAKCNNCHGFLSLHGGNRNTIEQCVLCHNPTVTDAGVRPADKMPAQTIQLAYMVHRIHTGEESAREYTVYGRGSVPYDFTEVRYPGDLRNCNACHVNGSEQLPLNENLLNVSSPRGLLNPAGPATAACTACHTSLAAASHALSNTTTLGEACAACHATGHEFGVPKIHAR